MWVMLCGLGVISAGVCIIAVTVLHSTNQLVFAGVALLTAFMAMWLFALAAPYIPGGNLPVPIGLPDWCERLLQRSTRILKPLQLPWNILNPRCRSRVLFTVFLVSTIGLLVSTVVLPGDAVMEAESIRAKSIALLVLAPTFGLVAGILFGHALTSAKSASSVLCVLGLIGAGLIILPIIALIGELVGWSLLPDQHGLLVLASSYASLGNLILGAVISVFQRR